VLSHFRILLILATILVLTLGHVHNHDDDDREVPANDCWQEHVGANIHEIDAPISTCRWHRNNFLQLAEESQGD
jgi:hypothetical protein